VGKGNLQVAAAESEGEVKGKIKREHSCRKVVDLLQRGRKRGRGKSSVLTQEEGANLKGEGGGGYIQGGGD